MYNPFFCIARFPSDMRRNAPPISSGNFYYLVEKGKDGTIRIIPPDPKRIDGIMFGELHDWLGEGIKYNEKIASY